MLKALPLFLLGAAACAAAPLPNGSRLMFCGDSITHGVNDATYRWQFFKVLVDNDIELEFVGPRGGFCTPNINVSDATAAGPNSYRGKEFDNVHLAQSSGRTRNIISGSKADGGVDYGGHSTKEAAKEEYNARTYICLMGTNDLLSDKGYEPADYIRKMQNMLGGTVTEKKGGYSWQPGEGWGTMGQIAEDLLKDKGDVLYLMSVPAWCRHGDNNTPEQHAAVEEFNKLLVKWCRKYSESKGKKVVPVDINTFLVDPASEIPFYANDGFFNRPGSDGVHPNEQGSLLIAGSLAKGIGLPGRTGGLTRGDAKSTPDSWSKPDKKPLQLKAGEEKKLSEGGAMGAAAVGTAEFVAKVGNGAKGGWAPAADTALEVHLGDGIHSGTLTLSENALLWNGRTLCCRDNSKAPEPVRVAWVQGNPAQMLAPGYYVWVGDVLVGQGLASDPTPDSGLTLRAKGAPATVTGLTTSRESLAPALTKSKK